jgi:putative transposon-encoded protein
MPIRVEITRENLTLSDEIEGFIQKTVTPFGTGAKVDCPKEYLGRKVYLVICKA